MRMNRTLLLAILGLILIIAAFSFYSYFGLDRASPPRIEIVPASYDFGIIPYRAVEKAFTVRNTGGSPLRITGVSTSCGCTRAELQEDELLPGEETELRVTFDPNLMSERIVGEVYRVVYIKSDDPNRSEIEIEIRATLLEGDDGT